MSDNPSHAVTKGLFCLIALSLVVLDLQHTGIIPRALAALFGGAS